MMKKFTLTICLLHGILLHDNLWSQTLTEEWNFQTKDRILSSPIVDEQMLYFGSEDGNFYAIDKNTGKELWHFTTRGRIQSTATVVNNIVFFESGNVYFALDKKSGKELWTYDPGWALWGYKIDPYDDKRSKAIVHKGVLYVGSSIGYLYGFDVDSGEMVFTINSDYGQPIRTTPCINNDVLYFGDWAGLIYAYDLNQKAFLWKEKTYESKPYSTFGGIASELIVHNGKLIFGARNPELKALKITDGKKAWSYADTTGGWIIGDPVIDNNILYIGGSDNFKMYAINPDTGKVKWVFNAKLNIYTKPIVTDKYIIFTSGNAYKPKDPGKLFVLNKSDGTLATSYEISQASFSSPAMDARNIYFGAYDGVMYKLNMR